MINKELNFYESRELKEHAQYLEKIAKHMSQANNYDELAGYIKEFISNAESVLHTAELYKAVAKQNHEYYEEKKAGNKN